MSVNSEKAIAVAAGIVAVLMLMDAWPHVSHWYRIWVNDGVYCFPVDEADGNYFLYGDDCFEEPKPILRESDAKIDN